MISNNSRNEDKWNDLFKAHEKQMEELGLGFLNAKGPGAND